MLSKRNRASFLIIVQLSHCHCLLCIQVVFQFSSNFKSLNRFVSSTCLLLFKCVYSPNFVMGVLIFFRCFYPSHDPQYVCWLMQYTIVQYQVTEQAQQFVTVIFYRCRIIILGIDFATSMIEKYICPVFYKQLPCIKVQAGLIASPQDYGVSIRIVTAHNIVCQ